MPDVLSWAEICTIAKDVDQNFRFPEAQAILPANPHRFGPYAIGAAANSDFLKLTDKLQAPADNLLAAYDFLDRAPNDMVYNDRFAMVLSDFAKVNAMAEIGGDPGAILAGAYATKRAEFYTNVTVSENLSSTFEGKANLEMLRRRAIANGVSPKDVLGTGLFKQNLPESARTNPLKGPYSPGKNPVWAQDTFKPLGFVEVAPIMLRVPKVQIFISSITGVYVFKILSISFTAYFYVRYILYIIHRMYNSFLYYKCVFWVKRQNYKRKRARKLRKHNLF